MKKLFVTFAAAGLILTGCSKNETRDYAVPDPDVISFSSSTSRASIFNLSTLTGDAGGFRVYGATGNVNNAWYTNVDGTNNYRYDSSNWGWSGAVATWPNTEASYPMNFYAMYPADAPTTVTAATALSSNITVAADASAQKDLLSAKATTDVKPASGQLTMVFKHIMSKVDFGIIAGNGMTPEIQAATIHNIHSYNTYDYMSQAWGATTALMNDYDYFRNPAAPFTTTGTQSEDTAVPFYAGDHANHLMLMPQSSSTGARPAWDLTDTTLPTSVYIEVVYRITDDAGDYIGYTSGSDYLADQPDYANDKTWGAYTGGLGTDGSTQYNGALYIKVGFPVTVNWIPGKGYTYNLCLGTADSTNGYFTDNTYYDNTGTDTGIPIIGGKGNPVNPGDTVTSGTINFLVDVAEWDDIPANPLK